MNPVYKMKGSDALLEVYNDKVIITPKGVRGFVLKVILGIGIKSIPFTSIKDILFKKSNQGFWKINIGYLHFMVPGGKEFKGLASSDENTFLFKKQDNLAIEIKDYIDKRLQELRNSIIESTDVGSKEDFKIADSKDFIWKQFNYLPKTRAEIYDESKISSISAESATNFCSCGKPIPNEINFCSSCSNQWYIYTGKVDQKGPFTYSDLGRFIVTGEYNFQISVARRGEQFSPITKHPDLLKLMNIPSPFPDRDYWCVYVGSGFADVFKMDINDCKGPYSTNEMSDLIQQNRIEITQLAWSPGISVRQEIKDIPNIMNILPGKFHEKKRGIETKRFIKIGVMVVICAIIGWQMLSFVCSRIGCRTANIRAGLIGNSITVIPEENLTNCELMVNSVFTMKVEKLNKNKVTYYELTQFVKTRGTIISGGIEDYGKRFNPYLMNVTEFFIDCDEGTAHWDSNALK